MYCRGVLLLLALTVAAVSSFFLNNSCRDNRRECPRWSQQGYCTRPANRRWMSLNCKKSCGYCGGNPATAAPPIPGGNGKCGVTPVSQTRVVNGFLAREGAWPWLASLQRNGGHFCGGTLITPTWVLTASHCVSSIKSTYGYRVVMGAHNRGRSESSVQARNMKRVIMHPSYNPNTLFADHALIEVDRPFQLNSRVVLGCLPRGSQIPVGSQSCYIAGWGMTSYPGRGVSNQLMQARMPVVRSSLCRYNNEVVCVGFGRASDPNACRGDSGGPLMCRNSDSSWTVHGVASFVVEYCKYYTGYSPVSKYLSWIGRYVRDYKQH